MSILKYLFKGELMGCVIELFMEVVAEVVLEGIASLFMYFGDALFPNRKPNGKLEKTIDRVATILSVVMFLLFLAGIAMLIIGFFDKISIVLTLGWIFLGISFAFILTGIIFKVVKSNKKE